ncbi:PhzF family phenazine biosynthesis protein [Desulfocurvus sp. DL9XJH121]
MTAPTHNALSGLRFRQADVFSRLPLAGNGLAVFPEAEGLDAAAMQALAREMRQFESIFLTPGPRPGAVRARIFTMDEELDFAGHPVLGAACVLHEERGGMEREAWTFHLNAGAVDVRTTRNHGGYAALMDQGRPEFGPPLSPERTAPLLAALGLGPEDLAPGLPAQVVSTGLPYLFLPLRSGLERVRVAVQDLEARLAAVGAKFSYPLDVGTREGRSWDNLGASEDIATGSAAGPAGAYLVCHGLAVPDEPLFISQGRFCHRPCSMAVRVQGDAEAPERVLVGGDVCLTARGTFD